MADRPEVPLIGITGRRLRSERVAGADSRYGHRTVDIFWTDFALRVSSAGGVPVYLPFESADADVVRRLDGLIITGGQDVTASVWDPTAPETGQPADPRRDPQVPDSERDDYEISLVRAAVELGRPLLGICRGAQVLNVALGGTLIRDVQSVALIHNQPEAALDNGRESHIVCFEAGSLAAFIYGPEARVNSWHHQAVDEPATPLAVSGRAVDGIAEAVEWPGRPILGLQWHPEWRHDQDPVFGWLVNSARPNQPTSRGDAERNSPQV